MHSPEAVVADAAPTSIAEGIASLSSQPPSAGGGTAAMTSLIQVPSWRRRKKSIVWDYFTIEPVGEGCTRACCKRCKQTFAYSTGSRLAGTSHLKRHISLGSCPKGRDKSLGRKQLALTPSSASNGGVACNGLPRKRPRNCYLHAAFDQERSLQDMVKMIIVHEYPLHMVEHTAFVTFIQNLQPRFKLVDIDRLETECSAIYLREKQAVREILYSLPGRICVTLDLYTSAQMLGYMCLTGHFIDREWKLQRRILSFTMVTSPHIGDSYLAAISRCLSDWNLGNKLFTITLDDSVGENIRDYLMNQNMFGLNGIFSVVQCYVHILNCVAHNGLEAIAEIVNKVRKSVKYVRSTCVREEKFAQIVQQLQVSNTRPLCLDIQTKWNTTYFMLLAASEVKRAFFTLETCDSNYIGAPSIEEWNKVEAVCKYLKILYEGANIFVGGVQPTSNMYFHEAWKIQTELSHAAASKDPLISSLGKPMHEIFRKYWADCSLVLAMAVVMDPRFKMKLVEFSYSKFYGDRAGEHVKAVDDSIHELYLEYAKQPLALPAACNGQNSLACEARGAILASADGLLDFDVYISEISSTQQTKSELDQYLEEALVPRIQEFDILNWWKLNELKYPTLSQMGRDLLAVPMSTVVPEFLFTTGNVVLDDYRSSLRPDTLEAVVCAKDWLQYVPQQEMVDATNAIVKVEY